VGSHSKLLLNYRFVEFSFNFSSGGGPRIELAKGRRLSSILALTDYSIQKPQALNPLYTIDVTAQPFNALELDLPPPPIILPPNVRFFLSFAALGT